MLATVLRLFGCLASLDGSLVTDSLFSQTCLITISSVRCLSRRFLLAWRGGDVKHTFMGGLGGQIRNPYLQSMLKLVP